MMARSVFFSLPNEGLESLQVDEMPHLVLKQSMTSEPANGQKGGPHYYQNQLCRATATNANGTHLAVKCANHANFNLILFLGVLCVAKRSVVNSFSL
ncbi:MAG: hypothetical protein ACJASL_002984 [Paraglaciecola sp.]|jgi:hypothetical protein